MGESQPRSPLPLAGIPDTAQSVPAVLYGMGRIDASGRISDRTMTRALGWRSGERLTVTATSSMVIARRDPVGMVILPAKPYVAIPAALRHRCGVRTGDRVLLAATPDEDTLAVYPLTAVHQAIQGHNIFASDSGDH